MEVEDKMKKEEYDNKQKVIKTQKKSIVDQRRQATIINGDVLLSLKGAMFNQVTKKNELEGLIKLKKNEKVKKKKDDEVNLDDSQKYIGNIVDPANQ